MAKKSKRRCDTLPVLHPAATGIDVGASELYVAVRADRDPQPVRSFTYYGRYYKSALYPTFRYLDDV